MIQKMCIYYVGVNYDHGDMTGDGGCLDFFDSDGLIQPCRTAIEKGQCHKNRTSPLL